MRKGERPKRQARKARVIYVSEVMDRFGMVDIGRASGLCKNLLALLLPYQQP
jgi:hypothetical protein